MAATISSSNYLTPPLPQLTTSTSTATTNMYDGLNQVEIPDKELDHLYQIHDSLNEDELQHLFSNITTRITQWLEVAHMTAFNIEQNIKREQPVDNIEPLLNNISKMAPLIPCLIELSEMIFDTTVMTITKIQSEWSGLQHFITSVKKLLETSNEKNQLLNLMSSILFQIDDLSLMIFQYQEKRHQEPEAKSDTILIEIDNRVGPLFNDVEKVYTRMTAEEDQIEDTTGLLTRKHLLVQEKWEYLRVEIDELKIELKEDRWLIVFKQVADQVDGMMDGLDKTVQQCYIMISQIRENGLSASNSTSTSISTSSSSTTASQTNQQQQANNTASTILDKLRSVEKNFDAKYKYYTPSITKMLMMLGNGIAARVSRNMATLNRHENMLTRWNNLKSTMDQLRKKDLPDISVTLGVSSSNRPMSPATSWSRLSDRSDNSSGLLIRSPEPSSIDSNGRSRSPYISSSPVNSFVSSSDYHHHQQQQQQDIYNRKATGTPPTGSRWQQLNNKSPSPVYGRSQQMSPLSHHRGTPEKRSNLVPSSSSDTYNSSISGAKKSANGGYFSPTTAHRQREQDDEDYDEFSISPNDFRRHHQQGVRVTTPTLRSKSSLSTTNRSMTPITQRQQLNRSTTPSMIPRPKTPTAVVSQSLIPRPKTPSSASRSPSRIATNTHSLGRIGSPLLQSRQTPVQSGKYKPNLKDPLDKEIGLIINSSPIPIQCQKATSSGDGKYYFGNELTPSLGGGKKIYTCKLMTYDNHTRGVAAGSPKRNKVLIRVGGGWQDLEIFLLEHMNLMGG